MHITKYGNKYSDQEWKLKQDLHKAEAEAAKVVEHEYTKLEAELYRRLEEFAPGKSEILASMIIDIDQYIDAGRIQFSSKDKEKELVSISLWYLDAHNEIVQKELGKYDLISQKSIESII